MNKASREPGLGPEEPNYPRALQARCNGGGASVRPLNPKLTLAKEKLAPGKPGATGQEAER